MKKTLAILLLAISGLALSSCSTVAGAGQDIQRGGSAITGAAVDAAN